MNTIRKTFARVSDSTTDGVVSPVDISEQINSQQIDGVLIANTGDNDLLVGLDEDPTETAYEYRISPGETEKIDTGEGVSIRVLTLLGTTTYSVKPFRQ